MNWTKDHWINLALAVAGAFAAVLGSAGTWGDVPKVFTPVTVAGLVTSAIGFYRTMNTAPPTKE
jgi:hypothetical protein